LTWLGGATVRLHRGPAARVDRWQWIDGVTTEWLLALAVFIAWFLAGVGIGRGWRLEAEARLRRRVRDLEEELTRARPEPDESVEAHEVGEAPR
jgi:hypothetical protein